MMRHFAWRPVVLVLLLAFAALPAGASPIQWSGNGHWYDLIVVERGLSWDDARLQAQALTTGGLNWDLATIASPGEQAFIQTLPFATPSPGGTGVVEYWLGGYQMAGASEPGGQWRWINNEGTFWDGGPVAGMYANWGGVEPNNSSPGESHLAVDNRYQWGWNDNDPFIAGYVYGFVAESVPVPEPATLSLLGLGLAGVAGAARRRKQ